MKTEDRPAVRPPAGPEEKEIRAKLARIRVGPGKSFDFKELSLERKTEPPSILPPGEGTWKPPAVKKVQ